MFHEVCCTETFSQRKSLKSAISSPRSHETSENNQKKYKMEENEEENEEDDYVKEDEYHQVEQFSVHKLGDEYDNKIPVQTAKKLHIEGSLADEVLKSVSGIVSKSITDDRHSSGDKHHLPKSVNGPVNGSVKSVNGSVRSVNGSVKSVNGSVRSNVQSVRQPMASIPKPLDNGSIRSNQSKISRQPANIGKVIHNNLNNNKPQEPNQSATAYDSYELEYDEE